MVDLKPIFDEQGAVAGATVCVYAKWKGRNDGD